MKQALMTRGATRILTVCAALKPQERVVIVSDFRQQPLAEALANAALSLGADVVVTSMEPRRYDGQEPPVAVSNAIADTDLVVSVAATSITHSTAIKSAIANGARGIMLSAFVDEQMIGGGIDADFAAIEPLCRKVAELLGRAGHARLTTPAGTDLVMRLDGREGNAHTGLAHVGGVFTTVPNIESSVSPVEGSAEGTIVADASIPYFGIGLLREPVRYTVERGAITTIDGGSQARSIAGKMAEVNDPAAYNIAQLSFGLNPLCQMDGIMLNDEGVYGTSHIGIGTSTSLGGTVKAPMHYDALMWRPTLELDGRIVLEDGVWLLEEAKAFAT
jgi:2,5-dihydroxypyridine 5,6-dioxygenase